MQEPFCKCFPSKQDRFLQTFYKRKDPFERIYMNPNTDSCKFLHRKKKISKKDNDFDIDLIFKKWYSFVRLL